MKAVSLILTRLTFFFKFPRISCTNLATSTLKFKLRDFFFFFRLKKKKRTIRKSIRNKAC